MTKLFTTIALALLILVSCKERIGPGTADVRRPEVSGISMISLAPVEVDSFYETSGTVRPKTTSIVSSRVMGAVTALTVREGERVKEGQTLMTLDDRDAVHRVAAAESAYREAVTARDAAVQNRSLADITHRRYANLHAEKVITQQEMDQVETQNKLAEIDCERASEAVARSRALLDEARVNLRYTRISSPHSGVVTERRIDQGSMATPGTPLLVVEDTSQFKVDAYVDERLAGKLKAGSPVSVALGTEGRRLTGRIGEIVPAVDPATRTFLVKVYLKDEALKSGLYAKVLIPEGKKETLLIPAKAVVEKGQLTGVYVVDKAGVMTYRLIRTGKVYGDKTEVLSGLTPGEQVVVGGIERAVDGGIVKSPGTPAHR